MPSDDDNVIVTKSCCTQEKDAQENRSDREKANAKANAKERFQRFQRKRAEIAEEAIPDDFATRRTIRVAPSLPTRGAAGATPEAAATPAAEVAEMKERVKIVRGVRALLAPTRFDACGPVRRIGDGGMLGCQTTSMGGHPFPVPLGVPKLCFWCTCDIVKDLVSHNSDFAFFRFRVRSGGDTIRHSEAEEVGGGSNARRPAIERRSAGAGDA